MLEFIIALLNSFIAHAYVFIFGIAIGGLISYMVKLRIEMQEDEKLFEYEKKFKRKGK